MHNKWLIYLFKAKMHSDFWQHGRRTCVGWVGGLRLANQNKRVRESMCHLCLGTAAAYWQHRHDELDLWQSAMSPIYWVCFKTNLSALMDFLVSLESLSGHWLDWSRAYWTNFTKCIKPVLISCMYECPYTLHVLSAFAEAVSGFLLYGCFIPLLWNLIIVADQITFLNSDEIRDWRE